MQGISVVFVTEMRDGVFTSRNKKTWKWAVMAPWEVSVPSFRLPNTERINLNIQLAIQLAIRGVVVLVT